MDTLLNQFCKAFDQAIRPVLAPFDNCAERLAAAGPVPAARHLRPSVDNLRHQLSVVADKVAEQHAYVLIFGPLKSGKSTLMNAMSASYVSEVTSLPAYPCMVYLAHADERSVLITQYDNETETLSDLGELRVRLARAHGELARQIRRVEAQGEAFDAQKHYPEAIRRIDLRVPAGDLAESGAVLVDTPGLYTRMRFGYDQMTRDFRDTAACAIFVVKSENLFLEQVFDEFTELLDLFTRVFLVVNLDTTRMDLKPDGSLAPALEKEDPIRIIEAFENLAMTSALKDAADHGRLRIFPIDLLSAAQRRLRGDGDEVDSDVGQAHRGQADFEAFLTNLTDYLNSNEYLVAFLGDSIRRARRLLEEAATLPVRPDVLGLSSEIVALQAEGKQLLARDERLGRLRDFDWQDAATQLWRGVDGEIRKRAEPLRSETAKALCDSLDGWLASDASMHTLNEDDLRPKIVRMRESMVRSARDVMLERSSEAAGGLPVPEELQDALRLEGIDVENVAREVVYREPDRPKFAEHSNIVPNTSILVRRSMWDWVLLRRPSQVQRKLFGASDRPTKRVPKGVKATRLPNKARESMRMAIGEFVDVGHPADLAVATKSVFDPYAREVLATVREQLDARQAQCDTRLSEIQSRLAAIEPVEEAIASLRGEIEATRARLESVSERYDRTDPDALRQPVSADPPEDDSASG